MHSRVPNDPTGSHATTETGAPTTLEKVVSSTTGGGHEWNGLGTL